VHEHVTCDSCGTEVIVGPRWKCADCADFNLCQACHQSFAASPRGGNHDAQHHFARQKGRVWKLRVGCQAVLASNFGSFSDAADGPLKPGVVTTFRKLYTLQLKYPN